MTYQKTIAELDPTINPVGVEACMRLQYGTLDHLSHEEFKDEIAIARGCEKEEPGFLRQTAESYGMEREFDKWEETRDFIVSIMQPNIQKVARTIYYSDTIEMLALGKTVDSFSTKKDEAHIFTSASEAQAWIEQALPEVPYREGEIVQAHASILAVPAKEEVSE